MNTIEQTPSPASGCRSLSVPIGQRRRGRTGNTLIEALVAMLVLSIGLLGIAGLASAALRYSQGAWNCGGFIGSSDLAYTVFAPIRSSL